MAGILSREKWNLKNEDGDNERFAEIDKIDLRDTKTLKEIEKLKDIEHLVLANMKYIKDWSPLSKLKKFNRRARKLALLFFDFIQI